MCARIIFNCARMNYFNGLFVYAATECNTICFSCFLFEHTFTKRVWDGIFISNPFILHSCSTNAFFVSGNLSVALRHDNIVFVCEYCIEFHVVFFLFIYILLLFVVLRLASILAFELLYKRIYNVSHTDMIHMQSSILSSQREISVTKRDVCVYDKYICIKNGKWDEQEQKTLFAIPHE